jgi:DNA (cytosine-5)-methyltransferase 1
VKQIMSSKIYQLICEVCERSFEAGRRDAKTCSDTCRLKSHRGEGRIRQQLVLSLFPGADLLGRAFENVGFTVVRGPDVLWGGDVREFHVPPGKFDGVIGGPPCQFASTAALTGTQAVNLIPDFLRIIEEAKPTWAVMENVPAVLDEAGAAPKWPYTILRDYDCGGLTNRTRAFWFHGVAPVLEPAPRRGEVGIDIERTLLATSWKSKSTPNFPKLEYVQGTQAAELQGFPGLAEKIMNAQPAYGGKSGLSASSRNILAVHMLGNGVPRAMGEYVARHVKRQIQKRDDWDRVDLPPYPLFMQAGK